MHLHRNRSKMGRLLFAEHSRGAGQHVLSALLICSEPGTAAPAGSAQALLKDVGISSQCLIQGFLVVVWWKRQCLALALLGLMETSGACCSVTQSTV